MLPTCEVDEFRDGPAGKAFRLLRSSPMPYLRALLGLAFFVAIGWLLSEDRRRISWRIVGFGVALQVLIGLILRTDIGAAGLQHFSEGVTKFLSFGNKGSEFVFGPLGVFQPGATPSEPVSWYAPWGLTEGQSAGWPIVLAFRALPIIIFFSAVMAILYHLGIVQAVVYLLARVMTGLMRVSGAESLAMAANVFVGQTEAPLVIKPYLAKMTRSELMALMTGGFATIAGSVLAAYLGMLGSSYAGHLLAASLMSAPAAFVMAKLMVPETARSETAGRVQWRIERTSTNLLDAAATGTTDGLKLYLNVLAMLIAFVSLVAVVDWPLSSLIIDGEALTLRRLLGWLFFPVAWIMGVATDECLAFGSLLGTKLGINEFVAYMDLAAAKNAGLSERSSVMAAYALCGFANFSSIGIQIGGIGALVPERREDLSRLALRAMLAGAAASWMTATIAGGFIHE